MYLIIIYLNIGCSQGRVINDLISLIVIIVIRVNRKKRRRSIVEIERLE